MATSIPVFPAVSSNGTPWPPAPPPVPQDQGSNPTYPGDTNTTGTRQTGPRPEYTQEKFLRYPYARIDNNSDYLMIQIAEFVPPTVDLNSALGNPTFTSGKNEKGETIYNVVLGTPGTVDLALDTASQANSGSFKANEKGEFKNVKHTICLPIPESISDTTQIAWGEGTLNPAEALGITFAKEFMDDPKAALNAVINALSNPQTGAAVLGDTQLKNAAINALSATAISALGGNVSANQLISRATGQVFNPNLELLFDGVGLRNFSFNFEFFARSKREAQEIVRIIRCLKRSMSAKKGAAGNTSVGGVFISAPDIFQLTYMKGNNPHPILNKFLPMALVDMQVNYTGSNTYSTFHDGMPSHIVMTLSFKELNPIYSEDYDAIYKGNEESVGY